MRYTAHGLGRCPSARDRGGDRLGLHSGPAAAEDPPADALPEILLGINQTIMMALSMLVITALVGTRDLGQEVYHRPALGRYRPGHWWPASASPSSPSSPTGSSKPRHAGLPTNGEARVSPDTAQQQSSARVAELAIWFGRVDPLPLSGGITNQNFSVEDRGRRYVVRVGSDIPVHGVVRANELAASRAAHLAGLAPGVVHAEPGIVVFDFVEGRTFTPEDVRNPANLSA